MTSASQALPAVLDRIDADIGKSIERLFELVRIPSISTDSAYKEFCKSAADFVARDLASLGFKLCEKRAYFVQRCWRSEAARSRRSKWSRLKLAPSAVPR